MDDNAVEQSAWLKSILACRRSRDVGARGMSEDEKQEGEERRSPWLGWSVGEQEEQREKGRLQAILRGRWRTSARISREQFGKVAHFILRWRMHIAAVVAVNLTPDEQSKCLFWIEAISSI